MFQDTEYIKLEGIVNETRWSELLPWLFDVAPMNPALQRTARQFFEVNVSLLVGLRSLPDKIVVAPALSRARGIIDYAVGKNVVELKTSSNVLVTHICQVALYTFSVNDGGMYDMGTGRREKIKGAVPALHYARYGVIAKLKMPRIHRIEVYPGLLLTSVTKLVQNRDWLESVFDIPEVETMCADLEAFLANKGMLVPESDHTPTELSILGTFVDVFVKVMIAPDIQTCFAGIRDELVRINIQSRRI